MTETLSTADPVTANQPEGTKTVTTKNRSPWLVRGVVGVVVLGLAGEAANLYFQNQNQKNVIEQEKISKITAVLKARGMGDLTVFKDSSNGWEARLNTSKLSKACEAAATPTIYHALSNTPTLGLATHFDNNQVKDQGFAAHDRTSYNLMITDIGSTPDSICTVSPTTTPTAPQGSGS